MNIDGFVFGWFNERHPDEMRRCLDAYNEQFPPEHLPETDVPFEVQP